MGELISFRGRGFPAEPIRMMIWIGLLTGLLIYQELRLWSAPYPDAKRPGFDKPAAETVDPYAEAERSRSILKEQEGAPPAASATAPGEATRISGAVHVIDGDTFHYGGMRVRIADIDTPEVTGRCAYETALAAQATQRLRGLLAAGPFELHPLSSGRDEDQYGRKLRIVTRSGQSLGDQLVSEGLARTWTGRRESWCA